MATASKDQTIRFIMVIDKAVKDLKTMKDELKGVGKQATGSNKVFKSFSGQMAKVNKFSKATGKGFNHTGKEAFNLSRFTSGLSTVTGGATYRMNGLLNVIKAIPGPLKLAALAIAGFAAAMHQAVKVSLDMEGTLTTLEVLTGDTAESYRLAKEAVAFSRNTPFMVSETVTALERLSTYGIMDPFIKNLQTSEAKVKTSAIGIVSSLGSIKRHGKKIGQENIAQGLLTGNRKMLRPVWGIIGPAYKKALKETKAAGQMLGDPLWKHKVLKYVAQVPRVMSLAKKHADSIGGMFSTIAGYSTEIGLAFTSVTKSGGVTMWTELKAIVKDIRDGLLKLLVSTLPLISSLGTTIGTSFGMIWDILASIWTIIKPIVSLIWEGFAGGLRIIWEILSSIFQIVGLLFTGVAKIIIAFNDMLGVTDFIGDSIKSIAKFVERLILWIRMAVLVLTLGINTMFDEAVTWIKKMPSEIKLIAIAIKDYVIESIDNAFNYLSKKWREIKAEFMQTRLGKWGKTQYNRAKNAATEYKAIIDAKFAKMTGGGRSVVHNQNTTGSHNKTSHSITYVESSLSPKNNARSNNHTGRSISKK